MAGAYQKINSYISRFEGEKFPENYLHHLHTNRFLRSCFQMDSASFKTMAIFHFYFYYFSSNKNLPCQKLSQLLLFLHPHLHSGKYFMIFTLPFCRLILFQIHFNFLRRRFLMSFSDVAKLRKWNAMNIKVDSF